MIDRAAFFAPVNTPKPVLDKLNAALADFSKEEFNELSRLLNKLIDTIRKTPIEGAD